MKNDSQIQRSKLNKGALLFWIYLKSMAFAFTGGLSAIPILQFEIVKKYQLLSDDEYLEVIALSQSLPGIIGLNNAILAGVKICGWFGALMAGLGTVLPAFFSMLLVAVIFQSLPPSKYVYGAIKGIRAVSVAIIFCAGFRIVLKTKGNRFGILTALAAFVLPLLTPLSTFYTILLTGAAGVAYMYLKPQKKDRSA